MYSSLKKYRKHILFLGIIAGMGLSPAAFSQPLNKTKVLLAKEGVSSLPAPAPVNSLAESAVGKGPASLVDKVLQRISENMITSKNFVDPAAEVAINREMNLSKSAVQMLRPIGFMQVGDQKIGYVLDDQLKVMKIKEGARIGMLRVVSISEFGVDYLVSGKAMFTPLSYAQGEPPKAPAAVPVSSAAPSAQPTR